MKTLLFTGLIAAALMAGCTTRPAPSGNAALMKFFDRADTDGDGKVSRREFTDYMIAEAFTYYDKNGSGFISLEEWVKGGGTAETFRAMGGGSDRKLSLAEVQNSKLARDQMALPFDGADTSRSGYLTREEFIAFRQAAAPYVR